MLHPILKAGVAAVILSCLIACGSNVAMLGNSEWQSQKDAKVNRTATIFVANVDFKCKVVSASADKLVVQQNGVNSELPMEVVSKIVFSEGGSGGHPILGAAIGGAVGIGVGYVVGHAAASSKSVGAALGHPLSLLCILGGAIAGGLIGGGSEKTEEYSFDRTLKPFILHPQVGAEITPLELRSFALFNDLASGPDETILQVQIFSMTGGKYLLLCDVSYSGAYQVKWRVVEESYINAERAKIKVR